MFSKRNFGAITLLAATLLLATTALAQTASITGTVTDAKDAVVQGASITVKNTATGAERATTSGSTGSYSVTNLVPGPYEVTVTSTGFKVVRISNLVLTVAQVATVNAKLEVGSASESLEIRGDELPIALTVDQVATVNAKLEVGSTSESVEVRGDELPAVELQDAQVSND